MDLSGFSSAPLFAAFAVFVQNRGAVDDVSQLAQN
jgi:hypothetical protein